MDVIDGRGEEALPRSSSAGGRQWNGCRIQVALVVAVAAILTEGAKGEVTVIVITLDVAAAGLAQDAEDVITTVIASLFAIDEL